MTNLKSILFSTLLLSFLSYCSYGQETHMAAAGKMTSLLETKYLKTGEIVLVERVNYCDNTRVIILNPDGSEEQLLWSGLAKFISFNELADNNWVLVIITDPTDDVPVPLTFQTITFIDGNYTYFDTDGDLTSIPLENISGSTVINESELVLNGKGIVYFTDFQLASVEEVVLQQSLSFLKSPSPEGSFLYYRYGNDDEIKTTDDKFETEQVIVLNLGDTFRNIHFLGDYTIFQDEDEISVSFGLFGFFYVVQGKKIYEFRQHGQNLTYYTLSTDSILTFNKIFLDEADVFQKDSFDLDLSDIYPIQNLHWDGDFKGYDFNYIPLPSQTYEDQYRGFNYVLNYNLDNYDLSTSNIDISIDDIEYTTSVDTTFVGGYYEKYYADIEMQITVTNNTDKIINDVYLHSAAFEGINCGHNGLKVDNDIIAVGPFESKIVNARYKSLEFGSEFGLQHPLCVYVIGANNKFDDKFNDNIYCLPLSEFTSTSDELELAKFNVFPNPSNQRINIDSETPNSTYSIYSIQGRKIIEWKKGSSNTAIDISKLDQGSYLIVEQKTKRTKLFTKI